MILCSTVRRLATRGANIYRVDQHAFQMCGNAIPSGFQYFATMLQARKFAGDWIGPTTVTVELCTMDAHYMLT